jgi:hypothetical protein
MAKKSKKKKSKRKGVNPNEKGGRFERKICQRLSLWVSNLAREDVFWRSAMSGGRAQLKSRKKRGRKFCAQSGDISAIHPVGSLLLELFVVECKWYKDLKLTLWLYGKIGYIKEIWRKPLHEAERDGKCPLIVAKQNHQQELVLTDKRGFEILLNGYDGDADDLLTLYFPREAICVLPFRDMIAEVSFDKIREEYDE